MDIRQLLVRLPENLAQRLRRWVPSRKRSAFMHHPKRPLLASGGEDDPLYQAALAVERDEHLAAAISEWDAVVGDGLQPGQVRAVEGGYARCQSL